MLLQQDASLTEQRAALVPVNRDVAFLEGEGSLAPLWRSVLFQEQHSTLGASVGRLGITYWTPFLWHTIYAQHISHSNMILPPCNFTSTLNILLAFFALDSLVKGRIPSILHIVGVTKLGMEEGSKRH